MPPGTSTPILVGQRTYDTGSGGPTEFPEGKLATEESYDDQGSLVVTREYIYAEQNGRLSSEITRFPDWDSGGAPVDVVTVYGYDTFGRVDGIEYPLEETSARVPTVISRSFIHGWPSSIDSLEALIVDDMAWNPAGGRASVLSGNGVESVYSSDLRNRPSRVTVDTGAGIVFDTGSIVYDGMNQITDIGADYFEYDLSGRIESGTTSANGQAADIYDLSFGYDLLGNMTSRSKTYGPPGALITFSDSFVVDPATNHLTSVNGTGVSYNVNGDLETDGTRAFVWGRRSRMNSVSDGLATAGSYAYDFSAYRVKKIDATQLRTTYYVRDSSGKVLSEFSKPTDSTLDPHWNRDYVYSGEYLIGIIHNSEPLEPSWVDSSATASTVTLSWAPTADSDLYGYHVYRTPTSGTAYERVNTSTLQSPNFVDASPFVDGGGNGIPTYYVVTAVDFAGVESRNSDERLVTAGDTTAPDAPVGLSAEGIIESIGLLWTAVSAPDLSGYDVFRSTVPTSQGGTFTQLNGPPLTATSYIDFTVTNGTTYYYKVKAVDTASNSSPYSLEASATPEPPGGGGGGGGGGGCQSNCPKLKPEYSSLLLPPCRRNPATAIGGSGEPSFCLPGEWIDSLADHTGMEPGREILYVHTDYLGSTRIITDELGQVVEEMHYFPFGEQMPIVNNSTTTHLFTGHERDMESELDYMLARYYGSGMGRFLSVDPGGDGQAANPQSWNRFSYVRNNPLKFNDPDGEKVNPVTGTEGINPVPERGTLGRIRSSPANPNIGQFGPSRRDEFGNRKSHWGVDLNAPAGTPVVAAATGAVTSIGAAGDAGNRVQLTLPDGTVLTYAHLTGPAAGMKTGQKVSEGQVVGTSGTSGNAADLKPDQQHLHFAVTDSSGARVNPVTWVNAPDPAPPPSDQQTQPTGPTQPQTPLNRSPEVR
jgi:RHS repeat-associated protein